MDLLFVVPIEATTARLLKLRAIFHQRSSLDAIPLTIRGDAVKCHAWIFGNSSRVLLNTEDGAGRQRQLAIVPAVVR